MRKSGKQTKTLKLCPVCELTKLMRGNQYICSPECVRQRAIKYRVDHKIEKIKSKTEWRELTDITEKLLCIYTNEGETVKQIAEDLSRPRKQVKSILSEAKKSGRYDKHIEQLKKYHSMEYDLQERGAI